MNESVFNKPLKIMVYTNAMVLIAAAMMGPIYALFVEKIGGDLLDASLTGGIFALAGGLTTLIAGRYADKLKEPELIIVLGYFMMGVGFFMYLLVDSILFLFLVQVIIGFAEAIYNPAFDAVYSRHFTKNNAGKAWGAWEAMSYFTASGGAILGGVIVASYGFNAIFIIMSILCFSSALYIYVLPRKVL